jgi:hypothetical protein
MGENYLDTQKFLIAQEKKDYEYLKSALDHGFPLYDGISDFFGTPVTLCTMKNDEVLLEMLISRGFDPNIPFLYEGDTPIHLLSMDIHNGFIDPQENKTLEQLLLTKPQTLTIQEDFKWN